MTFSIGIERSWWRASGFADDAAVLVTGLEVTSPLLRGQEVIVETTKAGQTYRALVQPPKNRCSDQQRAGAKQATHTTYGG